MTHRPALRATAVTVIHTTVQLCLTSCKYHWLLLLCVDMVRYTVEQRVFMYGSYVKCGFARKCRRKFRHKFPGITVPRTTGIHELINKVRATGSLLDKEPAKKNAVCLPKKKTRRNRG
jgi:hypothetical protein